MSLSPPIRRLSDATNGNNSKESLINAYEAEEERIINILSRKLEKLREEKIDLENALEAESESHVNRMARELSALRLAQTQQNGSSVPSPGTSPENGIGFRALMLGTSPADPSTGALLEALQRENEYLRGKLVDTERDYIRISRTNDVYREELIDLRRRLSLPVDNLIGLPQPEPFSQPTHRRASSSFSSSYSYSNGSSPGASVVYASAHVPVRPTHSVPIPRTGSAIHRPGHVDPSSNNTPLSHSPSSSESPFPFSPQTNSHISLNTNITSPPSSFTLPNGTYSGPRTLTYPSVPPPSLSSSFGSPIVTYGIPHNAAEISPIDPSSRRNSIVSRRSAEWRAGGELSRRSSVERGARIAETGSLVSRSRGGSTALPPTTETPDTVETNEDESGQGASGSGNGNVRTDPINVKKAS